MDIHSDVIMGFQDVAGMTFSFADGDSHLTLLNDVGITVAELDREFVEADYIAIGVGYAGKKWITDLQN